MTDTKTPREFWIHPEFDNKSWEFTALANKPIHHDFYIHVVEMSALTECRKELRLVRQNVDGQRRVNDRQYAEKLDLEEKLELQTKNCISLFLHESRVADLEAKLTEAHDGLAGNICGYCWDKKANEGYPSLDTKLTTANELIAELREEIETKIREDEHNHVSTSNLEYVIDKIKAYESSL